MTPKKLVFLGVLGLADCIPSHEPRSVAGSYVFFHSLNLLYGFIHMCRFRLVTLHINLQ